MTEAETAAVLGRLAALETLTAHMLAHLVVQFDQPVALAAHILDHVESSLLTAQQRAPEPQRQAADQALLACKRVSASMLAMINRIAQPEGQG